jgi:lysozyme
MQEQSQRGDFPLFSPRSITVSRLNVLPVKSIKLGIVMRLDKSGEDLIKTFEGCRLTAYQDSVGVWTIGYGSTGKHIHQGLTITQTRADSLFDTDVVWVENAVNGDVTVSLTQNQFNALCSFTYNLGAGALNSSTLLKDLNKGEYQEAADQFPRWDHAGGHEDPALLKRRNEEREIFLT